MECSKCKSQNPTEAQFCRFCGANLGPIPQAADVTGQKEIKNISSQKTKKNIVLRIIYFIIAAVFIGSSVYAFVINSLNKPALEKTEQAYENYDKGTNTDETLKELEQVADQVYGTENKIEALKNLAYAYFSEGRKEDALTGLRTALGLTDQGSFNYYLISGEIAIMAGEPSTAEYNYKKAIEINPDDFQAHNGLGWLYLGMLAGTESYTDYQKALYHNQKAYELDESKSEGSKENLAISYFFTEDYTQALSLFMQTSLETKPYNNFYVGTIYVIRQDYPNAKKYFQQAIDGGAELPPEIYQFMNSNL